MGDTAGEPWEEAVAIGQGKEFASGRNFTYLRRDYIFFKKILKLFFITVILIMKMKEIKVLN